MSWRVWIGKLRNDVTARVLDGLQGAKGAIAADLMTGKSGDNYLSLRFNLLA